MYLVIVYNNNDDFKNKNCNNIDNNDYIIINISSNVAKISYSSNYENGNYKY